MNITDITTQAGSHKKRKRVGRGAGSGSGKTAGRGHKGAGQRSGYRKTSLAEGGMFPLFRRIPKFGFNNAQFRTDYQIVNVADLGGRFDEGAHVTSAALEEFGLIRDRNARVKILGNGELTIKLTVEAHRFSGAAEQKIAAAGGSVKWLVPRPPPKKTPKRMAATSEEQEAKKEGKKPGEGKKARAEGGDEQSE